MSARNCRALQIVQPISDLLIIPVVHLGAGFLCSPPQRAKGRELIARLYQGFDTDVDDISQDVFTPGCADHRTHHHATSALTKGRHAKIITDERQVPLPDATLLVEVQAIVGQ